VKAIAVEDWLSPLKKPNGKALAPGTKKKIRDLMHVLYAHAIRYEWIDHNPISAVRQGGQRLSTPSRLSVDQLFPAQFRSIETEGARHGEPSFHSILSPKRRETPISKRASIHILPEQLEFNIPTRGGVALSFLAGTASFLPHP